MSSFTPIDGPRVRDLAAVLLASVRDLPPATGYRIAYSGGPDSHALLHAFTVVRVELAPLAVRALHVNHRLHPEAGAWEAHCTRICEALDVELEIQRVDAQHRGGDSPEAAARRARYQAFESTLAAGEMLCTAHHQLDQAETVLLQLFRGSGPRGIAGMPKARRLGQGWLARPWLGVGKHEIDGYVSREQLRCVHDESNVDPGIDRSYLRGEILPRLMRRWPGVVPNLCRAAVHQARASDALAEMAAADLASIRGPRVGTLDTDALTRLSEARRREVIREWLRELDVAPPRDVHVEHILEDALGARADAAPLVAWPGTEVRRYRSYLYASRPLPRSDLERTIPWPNPSRALDLPYGSLHAVRDTGEGVSVERCAGAAVEVRFRRGGERCRPCGRQHGQRLKKLLQQAGVPPWERPLLPLVYVDGELAAVADLWVCEGFAASPDHPGWVLEWRRSEADLT